MNSPLKLFFIFLISLFLLLGNAFSLTMRERHEQWMAKHGREYESVIEKDKRFHIFEQNVKYIENFNNGGNKSYKLAPNEFTDLTKEEFLATYTRSNGQFPSQTKTSINLTTQVKDTKLNNLTQSSIDWRELGVVTPVKQQGSKCEQKLIDCVKDHNHGCDGGYTVDGMSYVKNVGIVLEDEYPYVAQNGKCNSTKGPLFSISTYKRLPQNDIDALLSAVDIQPVAIDIDIDGIALAHYSSGVYDGSCSDETNHSVTIVGYRIGDPTGNNYWIVKNSWGGSWGEKGYIRIAMNESRCPVTAGMGPIAPIY